MNTFEEAVDRYQRSMGDLPQPSRTLSHRNDKRTGWVMRNVNGYLAYVPDNVGGVLTR